jgi:predicted nucleotidyltransferase
MKLIKTILSDVAKNLHKKYGSDIFDIILFGSFMKGKYDPKDIDVLIIFNKQIIKSIEIEFRNLLKEGYVFDINSTTLTELEGEGFIAKEGIYLEGISLITDKHISSSLGFFSVAFVKYDIGPLKGSKRISFYHALNGRGNNKGFLVLIKAKKYSESVIICDYIIVEKIKEFLDNWKLDYTITPALIPNRLKRILLE